MTRTYWYINEVSRRVEWRGRVGKGVFEPREKAKKREGKVERVWMKKKK
jgi:hypothetical protein